MNLGQNISSARKQKGISQEELANRLGVSRQAVSLWENDQTAPSLDNLNAIAKVLNVSIGLLTGDEKIDNLNAIAREQFLKKKEEEAKAKYEKCKRKETLLSFYLSMISTVVFLLPVFGTVIIGLSLIYSISTFKRYKQNLSKMAIVFSAVYLFASIVVIVVYTKMNLFK